MSIIDQPIPLKPIPERVKTPINLVAIVMEVLSAHFQFNSQRFKRDPADKVNSKLAVQQSHAFDTQQVMQRPGIYVKRGDIQFQRESLGDRLDVNARESIVKYHKRQSGTILVQCLADTGGEAEELAQETLNLLQLCETLIANSFNFLTFQVAGISTVGQLEEHKEVFIVTITIQYADSRQWEIQLESVPVKRIYMVLNESIAC